MGQALLQHLDGLDHLELLARAGRAGDHVDAAVAQAEAALDAAQAQLALVKAGPRPEEIAAGIQASVAKRSFPLLKKVGIQPDGERSIRRDPL